MWSDQLGLTASHIEQRANFPSFSKVHAVQIQSLAGAAGAGAAAPAWEDCGLRKGTGGGLSGTATAGRPALPPPVPLPPTTRPVVLLLAAAAEGFSDVPDPPLPLAVRTGAL